MENMDIYFINKGTCAVVPYGNNCSKVIEKDDEFIVNKSVKSIIEGSCIYFGSSYSGRFDAAKKILNMNYKLPIIIEESSNLIFFPTSSPRYSDCVWISLHNIDSYSKSEHFSKINFIGGRECLLDISYYSLENQIFRATYFDSLLRKRKIV